MATSVKNHPSAQIHIESYREVINDALEAFFKEVPSLLNLDLSGQSYDALKKLEEYSLRPGKRIRGTLASFANDYVTAQQYGEVGIQAAVALELVQNYLLIVDDVMDRSDMRRGKPTIHQLYLQEQDEASKDLHLANMLAVNVGLTAQHLVNIVISRLPIDSACVQQAMLIMHKNIVATGFGQIDDAWQQVNKVFTETDIIRKYRLKSSYYTFVNPLQVGLILAGKNDEKTMQQVEEFGLAAGVAFQMKDDLLGVFGDAATTGKPNTDDIEEGKYTLLVQYAFEHASNEDISKLKNMLGNAGVSTEDVLNARQIFEGCGAKKYVENKIDQYSNEAKQCLKNTSFWDAAAKKTLVDVVDFSISRKR